LHRLTGATHILHGEMRQFGVIADDSDTWIAATAKLSLPV
jgi:hypothetical protein